MTTLETKLTPTLAQKMLKITEDSAKIKKNGHNNYSNYDYVKAVDVFNEVQKLLVKNGVGLSISEVEQHREKNGNNFHTSIKSIATFYSVDNPKDYEEVHYYATAADTLDKDIYKAKTGGMKYLFTQRFLIVTDDVIDPEEGRIKNNYNAPIKQPNTSPRAQNTTSKPDCAKTSSEPGNYIIKSNIYGNKKPLKGLTLGDVKIIDDLKSCCDYYHGKNLGEGPRRDDINAMNEYIRYIRTQQELGLKI